jgi:hypothetical protein
MTIHLRVELGSQYTQLCRPPGETGGLLLSQRPNVYLFGFRFGTHHYAGTLAK